MTVTSADLSLWAAHRRAVVFTVSRRVPGVDPELAASCGLELLCVELLKEGDLADPLAFWSTAAVEVALRMTQEEEPVVGRPAGEPAALAPVRHALDFEVLNLAMERLPASEQQLLWDHHVGSRPVSAIADEIGVLPYAAKRRLRRAENRLASTFATAHAGTTADLECRSTRAALHDFVRNRLLPRRRQQVEDHMVGCSGCTRAFVDVRESYWMLRAGAPVLLLGTVTAESGLAAGAGAAGAAATGMAASGAGGWLTTIGVRAAVTARTLLTDPVSLTAAVAGGLFVTTAVTTGVAGSIGAAPSLHETGTVTVSVSAQDRPPAATRSAARSVHEDPTHVPELTGTTATVHTPPGLEKKDGVPPGLATSDGVPPGLATSDGVPPGLATSDGVPPGLAEYDGIPPGQAKKDAVPPGHAKKDDAPPGQAKKDDAPPGQAMKDDAPPGQAKKIVPPGQAKHDGKAKGHTAPGQARSRSTSTS